MSEGEKGFEVIMQIVIGFEEFSEMFGQWLIVTICEPVLKFLRVK
jgi:hypothetical protein